MSTAKVALTISPTEHEFLLAAVAVYVNTLARIEATACGRTPHPLISMA